MTSQTESGGLSLLFELFAASQAARHLLQMALEDSPLSPDEYAVYSVIVDEGPLTPTALRHRLGMPAPTVSDYLASMTGRHHLTRKPNPDDGRSQLLSLTKAGRQAHARTARDFKPAIAAFTAELAADRPKLSGNLAEMKKAAGRAVLRLSSQRPKAASRFS